MSINSVSNYDLGPRTANNGTGSFADYAVQLSLEERFPFGTDINKIDIAVLLRGQSALNVPAAQLVILALQVFEVSPVYPGALPGDYFAVFTRNYAVGIEKDKL